MPKTIPISVGTDEGLKYELFFQVKVQDQVLNETTEKAMQESNLEEYKDPPELYGDLKI